MLFRAGVPNVMFFFYNFFPRHTQTCRKADVHMSMFIYLRSVQSYSVYCIVSVSVTLVLQGMFEIQGESFPGLR